MPAGDDNQRRPPFLSEQQKRWALINFDRFVKPYQPKLDLSTHTNIGVIFSVLLVPAIIAHAIYQAVYIYQHPYDSAIATGITIGEAEMMDITCRAPWGCYVAMKYNSLGVSKLCYDTAIQSGFSGQKGWKPPPDSAPQLCTSMVYGEIIRNVTLCYSPDPYDGIYIAWNKVRCSRCSLLFHGAH